MAGNDITNAIIHLNQLSSGGMTNVEDLILNELPDSHQRMISHSRQGHFNNIVLETADIPNTTAFNSSHFNH